MAEANYPVLRPLVSPTPVDVFLNEYWPDRWFATHGAVDRLPPTLRGPELASFRALAGRYRGLPTFGQRDRGPRTITAEADAGHLYEMGLTVSLSDIAHCLPGADVLLRQLEKDLGIGEGSARIIAFASPTGDGVAPHFDAEDVFSVQLLGTKRWHVAPVKELPFPAGMQFGPRIKAFDELFLQSPGGFPKVDGATFETIDMQPGSVLFVPRGTWHRTEAGADSLSLSITLRPATAAESLLYALRNLLLQDPQWRRPLYGAWSTDKHRTAALERARALLAGLPNLVAQLAPQDLAPVSEVERLDKIDRASRFQRVPETRVTIEPRAGASMYHFWAWDQSGDETAILQMEVPAQFNSLFKWLTESEAAFSAGDLADRFAQVEFGQLQKVLAMMVRARFLKMLWFRPLSN